MVTSNWTDNSGYTYIELYPNGKYKSFVPLEETEWSIGGTRILAKRAAKIKFFQDGDIEYCVLAKPTLLTVSKTPVIVAANCAIEFHPGGNVRSFTVGNQKRGFFWLTKSWIYRGKTYDSGTTLEFSVNGEIIKFRT